MSAALVILRHDEAIIGVDTAVSTTMHGKHYRMEGNCRKVFRVDGNKLIFGSGRVDMIMYIVDKFKKLEIRNSYTLKEIAEEVHSEYKGSLSTIDGNSMDIFYTEYNQKKNKIVSTIISSYEDFNMRQITCKDVGGEIVLTMGFKTEELHNAYKEEKEKCDSLNDAYENCFNIVACDEIGGVLEIFSLNKDGARKVTDNYIKDEHIKRYDAFEILEGRV